MTYNTLTSSTQVSDLPTALNGVTTRSVMGLMGLGASSTAKNSTSSNLASWEFTLLDTATLIFPIPERVDILVAPTIRLVTAPLAAEASKSVAFTFASDTVHASATPLGGMGGDSFVSADLAVAAAGGTLQLLDWTLSTAVWDGVTSGVICGELTRSAIAAGTELVADMGVVAALLLYSIER